MIKVLLYKSETQHDKQKQQIQLYILSYIYHLLFSFSYFSKNLYFLKYVYGELFRGLTDEQNWMQAKFYLRL